MKIRGILFLVCFFIVLLFYYSIDSATNKEPRTSVAVTPQSSPTQPEVAKKIQTEIKKLSSFENTISQCLSANHLGHFIDPIFSLLRDSNYNFIKKSFVFSNTHIQLQNGEKRRIQLSQQSNPEGKSILLLKYFSETDEGLPWPIEIPEQDRLNPDNDVIAKYTQQGKIIFSQTKWKTNLDYADLTWTETNGSIQELEIFMQGNYLGCAQENNEFQCYCL